MVYAPTSWVDGGAPAIAAVRLNNVEAGLVDVDSRLTTVEGQANKVSTNVQAAAYTFVLADAGKVIESTSTTAVVYTVPDNATVPFPNGTVLEVFQYGAGQITISAAAGVTLRTSASLTSRARYSSISLRKRNATEWIVGGDLT